MKVRATTICYVGNGLRQPGDEWDYDGPMPDPHLEAVGDQSKALPPPETEDGAPKRTRKSGKKLFESEE